MGTRLTITPPEDFVLARDVCSYGYFLLAPNRWNPSNRTLTRPLDLEEGVSTRLLIYAASLIHGGMEIDRALEAAIIEPLTDEPDVRAALADLVSTVYG